MRIDPAVEDRHHEVAVPGRAGPRAERIDIGSRHAGDARHGLPDVPKVPLFGEARIVGQIAGKTADPVEFREFDALELREPCPQRNRIAAAGHLDHEEAITPERSGDIGLIGAQIVALETRRIDPTLTQAVALSVEQNWEGAKLIGTT
ncbi:MAG: hypothetical protein ACO3ZY_05870, partial [Phycisphaerales bacterium]